MTIQVFAILKEYFDKQFELDTDVQTIAALQDSLSQLNAQAAGVLQISRFAINNEFVDQNHKIKSNDTICIFPPSSGG